MAKSTKKATAVKRPRPERKIAKLAPEVPAVAVKPERKPVRDWM